MVMWLQPPRLRTHPYLEANTSIGNAACNVIAMSLTLFVTVVGSAVVDLFNSNASGNFNTHLNAAVNKLCIKRYIQQDIKSIPRTMPDTLACVQIRIFH